MKLSIAVCDDNTSVIKFVSSSITKIFNEYNVELQIEEFTSPIALLKKVSLVSYNVIFLDIKMPDGDGIEYAKKIKEISDNIKIVFVSSREERVFEAIQQQSFGFVRKTNFESDAREVILRYIKTMNDSDDERICLNVHGEKCTVFVANIKYFEGAGVYQVAYLKDGRYLEASSRMDKLEELLKDKGFLRVHKGYLVNFFYIVDFKSDCVILKDGENIPISRRKAAQIKEEFFDCCRKYNILNF